MASIRHLFCVTFGRKCKFDVKNLCYGKWNLTLYYDYAGCVCWCTLLASFFVKHTNIFCIITWIFQPFQQGDFVKPNYNSVDLAEVELSDTDRFVSFLKSIYTKAYATYCSNFYLKHVLLWLVCLKIECFKPSVI